MPLPSTPKKVAVIGAGAAGLVAARELKKEGHNVEVFERNTRLGGCWVYSPEVESDPLGLDPTRKIVESSLYASLRTNLPREVMGFRDFPFIPTGKVNRDSRRFPVHQEVLRYLEDFAFQFGLNELIRYQTEVRHVGLETDGKWMVKYRRVGGDEGSDVAKTYDAVVVCNGHYTEPRVADNIPGIDLWPGRQIHSHNYRTPEPYQDQVVVLIGLSASAIDICRDIAVSAKEVHVASRSEAAGILQKLGKHPVYDNLWFHPMIEKAHEDGRVSFQDGSVVLADVILHCTGYKQHFPFLHTNGSVNVDDNRVEPLYKHVFPPALAPGISFIGLPLLVLPFFLFELQSKWVAGVLSGRISLPSKEKMMEDVEALYSELEAKGVPKRHTHRIHDAKRLFGPFEYEDWLAAECGCPPAEEWRKGMFYGTFVRLIKQTETYRDEWDDEDLVLQAYEDFMQYLSAEGRAAIAAAL
ncbi:flavin-containing monooxygenase FMO GS-OX-like 4 [Chenopodium quinoa]|uniref:Flavin-containing monooxygenase n=1 Tax=Chenopodium quinoa TaxID=63459 RepID=A0A803LMA3_CHEQI|nr:flavin-containing monooxygenase FMO GS-OX-like 4 [Chenopodium quinoa]